MKFHTLHIKYTGRQPFAVRTVNGLFLSVTTYFLPFIFITIIGEIKADKTTSIHVFPVKMLYEELKVTKRVKLLEKELREKEESLFFAEAQIDVDTDKEIEELTNSYNFNVLTSCKFKIRVYPNS